MNKQAIVKRKTNFKNIRKLEFTVTEQSGLLEFLLSNISGKSRNNIKALLTHREVSVDGEVITRHDYALKKGQIVSISNSGIGNNKHRGFPDILFEDEDIIVIDKPSGLVSVSTEREKINTAFRIMNDYVTQKNPGNRIFIVHRLDKDTSGVLLFAKNEAMKYALQEKWSESVKIREYIAVVEGNMIEKSGRIHSWLKQTKTLLMYSTENKAEGLEAVTNYEVINETNDYSMLKINLETGRKNQIRVHMKDLGHSIAGDKKYGAKTNPLNRLGLHASKLEIVHPFSKKTLYFESPVPDNFNILFGKIRNK